MVMILRVERALRSCFKLLKLELAKSIFLCPSIQCQEFLASKGVKMGRLDIKG